MSAGPLFNREKTESRLGPAAVAKSARNAATAPPFRTEQIAFLKSLYGSVRIAESHPPASPTADAA